MLLNGQRGADTREILLREFGSLSSHLGILFEIFSDEGVALVTQDTLPSPVGLMPVREPVVRQRAPFGQGKRVAVSRQNKGGLLPVVVGQNSAALQPKKKKPKDREDGMRLAEQGTTRYSQVLHRGPVLVEREVGHLGHLPGPPHWALRPAKESPHPRHGGKKAPCSCRSTRTPRAPPTATTALPLALRPNNFSGNVSSE